MKAAMRDRYGGPEVVEIREVDKPAPIDDQVLVRVIAASVNRADIDYLRPRWQFIRLIAGLRKPHNPKMGSDVCGVVEAVGPQVTALEVGDAVFGDLFNFGTGAFAEYVSVPQRALGRMPAGMSFEDAATLPHSAVLALQGLRTRRGRTAGVGDKVLIVGASGNVGPFAVQIAKSRGAHVTGVASAEKLDFVRSLGADEVLDYRQVDPARTGERYDWIVDVDAHASILHWRHALTPKGVYVAMGGSGGWLLQTAVQGPAVGLATGKSMGLLLWWKPFDPDDIETLKGLIAAGKLKPHIDKQFALDEIAEAIRYVDEGRSKGKVVITMEGGQPGGGGPIGVISWK